ncbi:RHS repeat-associated core domain-containing protein [Pseudomonas sp. Irchel 3A7]|jgi:RHS repeat-associated protein|uniref:RHS repeat-associated core domain-containing protein n=1 Tax=Pseudomonas sp. Irchel 3A7 TaxID=2008913 RepID=UPI000BA2E195|nr:RHS repeat-associated core domain-containing protein [Pseudomonas sp. Irchel 3A7]
MQTPSVNLRCRYHYDALDRLITHTLPGEPEQQRFYCKSRLATEIKGAIRYSIFQHGDQLLAQQQSEAGALDTTLLATDLQRSVLNTVKANHLPEPNAYAPYGHSRADNGLTSLLGFNGERRDLVTGDYLLGNGHRAFNPVLMRFNSPDSLSPFDDGGLNPYAYCLGDPINGSDKTGQWTEFLAKPLYKIPRSKSIPAQRTAIKTDITAGQHKSAARLTENRELNNTLRHETFLEDYRYAKSTSESQETNRVFDIVVARVTGGEAISPGPKPLKSEEARRLLPLFEHLISFNVDDKTRHLKAMQSNNFLIPKGLDTYDIKNYHNRLKSIRNPYHSINKMESRALAAPYFAYLGRNRDPRELTFRHMNFFDG